MATPWFRSILCVLVAGAAIWGSFAANREPLYNATAEFTIFPPPGHPPSVVEGGCWDMRTYQYAIEEEVIRKTSPAMFTPAEAKLVFGADGDVQSIALKRNVTCEWRKGTRILRVHVRHANRKAAELLANRYVDRALSQFTHGETERNRSVDIAPYLTIAATESARAHIEALLKERNARKVRGEETIVFKQTGVAVAWR